jgi:signal transduction histidine kinase
MAAHVATEQRLLQQEKLSTIGLIASSLAHEIKNPLSSIKTIIRVLHEDLGADSRYADDLRMISGEIDRLSSSTSELLAAARPARWDRSAVPLLELLSPTLRLLGFLARQCEVTFDSDFPTEQIVFASDPNGLREIVFNLISNAVDAAGERGRVQLICRHADDKLQLDIHDNGPGIPAEILNQIFEPFFTTKATGTGLGLCIVARRVHEMGGSIRCQSDLQTGTTFQVNLPCRAGKESVL